MSNRMTLRYVLPAVAAVALLLAAAWFFGLRPASALTERDNNQPATTSSAAFSGQDSQSDAIYLSGRGTATGTPDLAELSLSVSVTADTVAEARTTAAEAMAEVRESLTDKEIAEDDIATSHFRIHPEYEYGPDGRSQIGYTVSNGLNVTVRDTDDLGDVIDSAVAAGGDHLVFDGLDFRISDTSELERDAREAAVDNLAEKAGQFAEFTDRELGNLRIISESPIGEVGGPFLERGFAAQPAAAFDTPISAGQQTITVVIYGMYDLGE